MADEKQTLDIPNGVSFSFQENAISLGNEHDVFIRGNMGYRMKKVFSKTGSIQLLPPDGVELDVDEIDAPQGDVFISGRVRAMTIRAQKIFFQEGALKASQIRAEKEVHLKGKMLNIMYVGAPQVEIDPECKGLCLVVECKHEVPKGDYTGGFRTMDEAKQTFSMFMDSFQMPGQAPRPAAPGAPQPGVPGIPGAPQQPRPGGIPVSPQPGVPGIPGVPGQPKK